MIGQIEVDIELTFFGLDVAEHGCLINFVVKGIDEIAFSDRKPYKNRHPTGVGPRRIDQLLARIGIEVNPFIGNGKILQ